MDATARKRNGVHYTPHLLARFLARCTVAEVGRSQRVRVLDPACGDGMLLHSFVEQWQQINGNGNGPQTQVHAFGFDIDGSAVEATNDTLNLPSRCKHLKDVDFLDVVDQFSEQFDAVIANPPYVRTQVLGEQRSRQLADRFQLEGRVDLYHAFVAAIEQVLKPGGVVGLLTSNRFLTTRAGGSMRRLLDERFELKSIFDLGDTRLFSAAVLPAIVIAVKKPTNATRCRYSRVYRTGDVSDERIDGVSDDWLDALNQDSVSSVDTEQGRFSIERGWLHRQDGNAWSLSNAISESWLAQIRSCQAVTFGDLAEVKVGIKTTADSVFIREDWGDEELAPEAELLLPLLTHRDAQRWAVSEKPKKSVLYPYPIQSSTRRPPIPLDRFPKAAAYLGLHREQLEKRKYLREAGRAWYEIWVPHRPNGWREPKIVWPDISERPRFFLDYSGAIVNGDCYWIKLKPDVDPAWLYLMLAVANSRLIEKFYDVCFHNKLYAGRRRFMTQYVKAFPLPPIESSESQALLSLVRNALNGKLALSKLDEQIDLAVEAAFGFRAHFVLV